MMRRAFTAPKLNPWRVLVFLALAAVFLGNRGFRNLVWRALEIRRLKHELDRLGREEAELKAAVERVQTSDFAIESAARLELGFMRPDELEYRFPPPGGRRPGSSDGRP